MNNKESQLTQTRCDANMSDPGNTSKPEIKSRRNRSQPHFWRRVFLFLFIGMLMGLTIALGAGLSFVSSTLNSAPQFNGEIVPSASSMIFDANGNLLKTVHAVEHRLPIPLSKIPKDLQNAFIATEDARFYEHSGIDLRAILRAAWANFMEQDVTEGASTITQQLARNAILSQERTIKRKIHEAYLAFQLEQKYSKAKILEMYLNQIYFGNGAYGVQAAAQVYFGKQAEDLDLAECALLAGIPKSPNYYTPTRNMKAAKTRQGVVLSQMVKYGYIDAATAQATYKGEIHLAPPVVEATPAAYFVDFVLQTLIEKYGADIVYKQGLRVYTTLDPEIQSAAEKTLFEHWTVNRTSKSGVPQPQGALVALDPRTGQIKAMAGGRGTDQFNRAVLAERQPGSAFKPFVYLTALDNSITPGTVIEDKPFTVSGYSPLNYDRRYHGAVTVRHALEQSLNVVAVKLNYHVGPAKVIYTAQQMGITTLVTSGSSHDITLAMALGGLTRGVTPLEMASAYGVLANTGIRVEPTAILKIVDRNGKVIEEAKAQGKAVINPKNAYILVDMMKGVMTRGTGTGANIGRPAAGKTGTTSDHRDAWFVGFTPNLSTAVWLGNDDNVPISNVTGGDLPATIWKNFMTFATAKLPADDFIAPEGITPADLTGAAAAPAGIRSTAPAAAPAKPPANTPKKPVSPPSEPLTREAPPDEPIVKPVEKPAAKPPEDTPAEAPILPPPKSTKKP
ncbi:MAG TPA: PBP1A family penicillin-binding protein [Patescibacteria group bacterium]|nr:PBP1A family penicillin-binding protein [Patescibacteria group bacterium]